MVLTDISAFWRDCKKRKMKSNFEIFVYRSFDAKAGGSKAKGEALIRRAALLYGAPKSETEEATILRTPKGKPYFEGLDLHFNISHSGNIWICLMGPSCCGADVQHVRPCNFEKIAGRFFSAREKGYVEENGIEGFFDIWTRREAYGKYTGEGFFGRMPEFVSDSGELIGEVFSEQKKTVTLKQMYVGEEIKCAACFDAEEEGDVKIREELAL